MCIKLKTITLTATFASKRKRWKEIFKTFTNAFCI